MYPCLGRSFSFFFFLSSPQLHPRRPRPLRRRQGAGRHSLQDRAQLQPHGLPRPRTRLDRRTAHSRLSHRTQRGDTTKFLSHCLSLFPSLLLSLLFSLSPLHLSLSPSSLSPLPFLFALLRSSLAQVISHELCALSHLFRSLPTSSSVSTRTSRSVSTPCSAAAATGRVRRTIRTLSMLPKLSLCLLFPPSPSHTRSLFLSLTSLIPPLLLLSSFPSRQLSTACATASTFPLSMPSRSTWTRSSRSRPSPSPGGTGTSPAPKSSRGTRCEQRRRIRRRIIITCQDLRSKYS